MIPLTIVTSSAGYGHYLRAWAESIVNLTIKPAAVCIYTHGLPSEAGYGSDALDMLYAAGIPTLHRHSDEKVDFGTARNRAVSLAKTEWVMHLDADDMLMPHALEDIQALMPEADVIAMGYERSGDLASGPKNKTRTYSNTTGLEALEAAAPCSGVSPFRKSLWEASPYRTDMRGAWDTALWIGFARLGARFRATKRPCFWYRQHGDSIFNKRRTTKDWTHQLTTTHLGHLRANFHGTAIICPLSGRLDPQRAKNWAFLKQKLTKSHPNWPVFEGFCKGSVWSKGQAIRDALNKTGASILVVTDADCMVDPMALEQAVAQVEFGGQPWAIPHLRVNRLKKEDSERVLGGWEPELPLSLERPAYQGFAGGGIFVCTRLAYEATGGIPDAFTGWGCEDEALALILDSLIGPHWRGTANLWHLWHPPQLEKLRPRKPLEPGNRQNLSILRQAVPKGEDAVWAAVQKLGFRSHRKVLTPDQIAERRRRQTFLGARHLTK